MVDEISHVSTRLIHAEKSQTIKYAGMYFPTTVGNNAYNYLWPR
jgi:hypothetical protein